MAQNTQLAKITPNKFIDAHKSALAGFAVRDYDNETFINSMSLLMSESKELQECMQTQAGQVSLYNACKYAASTGLSLNPMEGKATIIAYNGKASYQIMKNGYIQLALESPDVKKIISQTVRENDEFLVSRTMDGDTFKFVPAQKSRGPITGFFAAAKMTNGETSVEWMTVEDVNEVRDKYSANFNFAKDKTKTIWHKSYEGQGLKTVLKKMCKNLHVKQSGENGMAAALTGDDFDPDMSTGTQTIEVKKSKGANSDDVKNALGSQKTPI
jgi:recombination protein RecT